jgi:RNA polymerase sigma-70 factor (ECF subfamily)
MIAGSPGAPSITTNTTLLAGLADGADQATWRAFVARYRPVLVRHARRSGCPETDAEDVAQQTLAEFARCFREGKFRRDRGRLRDWLFGIARHQLRRWARGRGAHRGAPRPESDEGADRAAFDEECERALLAECLEAVRAQVEPATYQAFELFAVRGVPAAAVAEQLGTTENAVFLAKRRVLTRLRELLTLVEDGA